MAGGSNDRDQPEGQDTEPFDPAELPTVQNGGVSGGRASLRAGGRFGNYRLIRRLGEPRRAKTVEM